MTGEGIRRGRIVVVAGVNGAGKSTVLGAMIRDAGANYFNPDEAASRVLRLSANLSQASANAYAWEAGRRGLERAIAQDADFAFETTLGGRTITNMLDQAIDAGREVHMRYIGLDSPERHLARVRARVAAGGHDIPAENIRERFDSSRENLIRLLPKLSSSILYDNSLERAPIKERAPEPRILLALEQGSIRELVPRNEIPRWAEPIVAAAIVSHLGRRGRDQ